MSAACKYTEFDHTPGSVHNQVVDLVTRGARVLEFGCATGYMSEIIKERREGTVTGIEISEEAASVARSRCDRVINADAEQLDYAAVFRDEEFDAIVFADVLEHLRNPAAVLRAVRSLLAEDGAVIASIPNVAHGSVRLSLLGGDFRYRSLGLLDEGHLRFFTKETIDDLFQGSGYLITHLIRQRLDIDRSEIALPAVPLTEGLREWLEDDPDATTYQFILQAVPSDSAQQVLAMREEQKTMRQELETLRREAAALAEQSRQLDALRQTADDQEKEIETFRMQIESLAAREFELRELLLDAHDQLLHRDDELAQTAEDRDRLHEALRVKTDEARREQSERDERVRALTEQIHWMETRRVWRLGTRWWRLKAALTPGRR